MASIYKPQRLDPATGKKVKCQHYRIAFKDENGRRRTVKGYKDKSATEAKAREIERRVERIKAGLIVASRERDQPLELSIDAFLADLARRGSSAKEFYHRECKRILNLIRTKVDWKSLASVRADQFTKYLTKMAEKGNAPRTQNRHQETLRCFLNWCVAQGWIEVNPIAKIPMAPIGQAGRRRRRRAYTIEEWQRLLAVVPEPRRGLYKVAAYSGLRRSELSRLEKQDAEPMRWKLRGEITKNGNTANLPMLQECWNALKPFWETCTEPRQKLFATIPDMETVVNDLRKAKIARQDALGRWADFHSFRYFFCTILAKKLPIQLVRTLMRHGSIKLTCDLYMDLGLEDITAAVMTLPPIVETESNDAKKADAHGGADSTMLGRVGAHEKNDGKA